MIYILFIFPLLKFLNILQLLRFFGILLQMKPWRQHKNIEYMPDHVEVACMLLRGDCF